MGFLASLFGGGGKEETSMPTVQPLPQVPTQAQADATVRADEVRRKIKRTKTLLTDEDTLGAAPVAGKTLLGE
jgi:hypothetical protein